ncbi:MAG: hypothetical protein E6R03_12225 [Hyphomicrobiaceae bacterium]|nr:MAG: hypothetical protein E6R03_12225 [Hyphomicrobiaceae bacterium]
MNFTFITEDGRETIPYSGYLKNPALRKKVRDPDRVFLNLGDTIISYDQKWLAGKKTELETVRMLSIYQKENPIQFFLPHGEGAGFLNDTRNDVMAIIAPNRTGKTTTAVVSTCLDLFPCDKDWPIFTRKQNAVHFREFRKPLQVGVATYNWVMMQRTLWPIIKSWIPKFELGEYAEGREPNWRQNPSIRLQSGSELFFFVYEQGQDAFESQALDRWLWDEQPDKAKFDGGDERTRTRLGLHRFALTPHAVEGRPDTGGGGWLEDFLEGHNPMGHRIGKYRIMVPDVPDWVYPNEAKEQAKEKWVDGPRRTNNAKMIAEGKARYYGEWHRSSGLLLDDFDENVHVIPYFKPDKSWTRYRGIDHGLSNPSACLCVAVSPENDIYAYAEYYEIGVISENAERIVKMAGNKLLDTGTIKTGNVVQRRQREQVVRTRFHRTVLDGRSYSGRDPNSTMTIGRLYEICGLKAEPASGADDATAYSIVKQYLVVDGERINPVTKKKGSPRLFIMDSCPNLIRQVKKLQEKKVKGWNADRTERANKKDDHLVDCLKYICQIPPSHIAGIWAYENDFEEEPAKRVVRFKVDPHTGY